MGKLTPAQQAELRAMFGPRVAVEAVRARLPGVRRALLGGAGVATVVQPESRGEVSQLVAWAAACGLPVTPRGRSTAPYGGAVPVQGGVVVDFGRMNRVLAVDAPARTATVEAGVVWEALDRKLMSHDLTLRLYPTSYATSTVGGWLAQGGAGIGSYGAGWLRDNVLRAHVVLPDGMSWELAGPEVDLVADAEGTTGLITDLTVRVQPQQEMHVLAVACPDAHALEHLVYLTFSERTPLWSLSFLTPAMVRLLARAEPMDPPLPEAYLAVLAFPAAHRERMLARLPGLLGPCQAEPVGDTRSAELWSRRFEPACLQRRTPGRVPAAVVVPLAATGDFCNAVQRRADRPLAMHGVVVRTPARGWHEIAFQDILATNARGQAVAVAPAVARDMVAAAVEHGGRAYGTGLFFPTLATGSHGAPRAKRLAAFKKQEDPRTLMNPGKVFGSRHGEGSFRLKSLLAPVLRPLGWLLGGRREGSLR